MPPPQPLPDPPTSLVERRIREAMAAGEFDDLPGKGKPLTGLDRPYDPDWWARQLLERELLRELLREEAASRTTARVSEAYAALRQCNHDSPLPD